MSQIAALPAALLILAVSGLKLLCLPRSFSSFGMGPTRSLLLQGLGERGDIVVHHIDVSRCAGFGFG
jgi:hypothetical protein